MTDGNIAFNASLKTAGFDSGAKRLQNVASSTADAVKNHFGKIAAAVVGIGAAFIGVRAAVESFNAAIAMGGKLNDLSARTGETAGNLAILQRAFENAGAGADAVGPTINRLQRAIVEAGEGGKQQAEAFAKLGLNLSEIRNLTPTEQLQAVAKALQAVGNDSDRGAIAMQLLGRSGGELLPLLRAMGTELEVARGQLGSLPGVMDRTNQALDTIGDNFGAIAAKGTEFAAGLLEKVAPALADVTTKLANIDAAGFGVKLSEYVESTARWIVETFKLKDALNQIEVAVKGVTSGNFGDSLSLMFMTARDTALNAINTIVAAASAAIETVSGAMSQMFRGDGPLVLLLKTTFTVAANYLKEALYGALAEFMDAIGRGGMAESFRYQAETAARSIEMLTGSIGSMFEEVGEDAKTIFKGIPEGFAAAYKANLENPLFEMKDRAAETAAQMEKVAAATRAAAFDAEKFGDALAEGRLDRLTGDVPSSPRPPDAPALGIFGMDPASLPPVPTSGGGGSGGGGSSLRGTGPKTAFDQLRELAKDFDRDAMTAVGRIGDRAAPADRQAAELTAIGMHRSAANAAARAERIRQREAAKALERMGRDAAQTERERESLAESSPSGRGGAEAARAISREPATESTLKQILEKIQERPILVA